MVMKRRFEDPRGKPLVDYGVWLVLESSTKSQSWSAVLTQAPFYLHSICNDKPCVSFWFCTAWSRLKPMASKKQKILRDIHLFGPELLPGMLK